jgi:hypothetical protein
MLLLMTICRYGPWRMRWISIEMLFRHNQNPILIHSKGRCGQFKLISGFWVVGSLWKIHHTYTMYILKALSTLYLLSFSNSKRKSQLTKSVSETVNRSGWWCWRERTEVPIGEFSATTPIRLVVWRIGGCRSSASTITVSFAVANFFESEISVAWNEKFECVRMFEY